MTDYMLCSYTGFLTSSYIFLFQVSYPFFVWDIVCVWNFMSFHKHWNNDVKKYCQRIFISFQSDATMHSCTLPSSTHTSIQYIWIVPWCMYMYKLHSTKLLTLPLPSPATATNYFHSISIYGINKTGKQCRHFQQCELVRFQLWRWRRHWWWFLVMP